MPRLRVCTTPLCDNPSRRGRCTECRTNARRDQAAQRRAAGDTSMAHYSSHRWRTHRAAYLRTHTTCACGCGGEATEVNHRVPRQLLVALGIHDPDHPRWLEPLTHSCHSRTTQLVDVPLLERWRTGEDAAKLADEAMELTRRVG